MCYSTCSLHWDDAIACLLWNGNYMCETYVLLLPFDTHTTATMFFHKCKHKISVCADQLEQCTRRRGHNCYVLYNICAATTPKALHEIYHSYHCMTCHHLIHILINGAVHLLNRCAETA